MVIEGADQTADPQRVKAELSQSTDQVRYHQFSVTRKGYDQTEVLDSLRSLADWIDQLKAAVRVLEARVKDAEKTPSSMPSTEFDPYDELASRVASVLRSAEEYADGVRRSAEVDAERGLAEATGHVEEILRTARIDAERSRSEAERIVVAARSEADRVFNELRPIHAATLTSVRALQRRLMDISEEMEGHIGRLQEFHRVVSSGEPSESTAGVEAGVPPSVEAVWGSSETEEHRRGDVIDVPDIAPVDQSS